MADFCAQCAEEMWGNPFENDFKGILTQDEQEKGLVLNALCEGCGGTYVDRDGICLTDCMHHHAGKSADEWMSRFIARKMKGEYARDVVRGPHNRCPKCGTGNVMTRIGSTEAYCSYCDVVF